MSDKSVLGMVFACGIEGGQLAGCGSQDGRVQNVRSLTNSVRLSYRAQTPFTNAPLSSKDSER